MTSLQETKNKLSSSELQIESAMILNNTFRILLGKNVCHTLEKRQRYRQEDCFPFFAVTAKGKGLLYFLFLK